ncbi:cytochrome c biogenesis CcdA family protein [Corynebacterium liangguodongii]|uniref:Cytochrome C biogenesis protein ResC n=1 Tax=Corynebacterium liangguodongii TaxID=2079535 RepID=A0A2S0WC10_9CORY|nr:cytochrome c biogenesis CcdA family protein [Corynebacterium liangguodongii]AWB83298.1 cytochrome C biogenesis protein ResC [Corynebacterium liangguodongii]PWC00612.1 cytochrome c biogenesis protein CcdA [Corynebacterium liangguodongii]
MGEFFSDLVLTGPLLLGAVAAAVAGLVSFASPCVIPLVPGYLSYLTGVVGGEMEFGERGPRVATRRASVAGAAGLFVLGFTVVFLLATVSVFGAIRLITLNAEVLMRLGGVVTILMGLVFMGAVPLLQRDTRPAPRRWTTLIGAPLLGGVFALGWTPCLGPTLAAIISVSVGTEGMTAARGIFLVTAYCVGLGLPFVLLALGSAQAVAGVDFLRRHSRAIQIAGGVAMIVVGLMLVTGAWGYFVGWSRQLVVGYGASVV